jgi:hypothetical protein
MTPVAATIAYLKRRQEYRAAGGSVCYTTSPAWLVNMAINRRAAWPDDPSHSRGSCTPVNGSYPKKAIGEAHGHLRLIAWEVNHNIVVRPQRLGEWRNYLLARIRRERFTFPGEE